MYKAACSALSSNYFQSTRNLGSGAAPRHAKLCSFAIQRRILPDYPVTVKSLSSFVITLFAAAIDAHDNLFPSVFTPRLWETS